MHATYFDAYTYDGAVYCKEHLPEGVDPDGDEISPIFADSEWDSWPVCDECGYVHDYVSLTIHGQKAMRPFSDDIKHYLLGGDIQEDLPAYAWPGGYPFVYYDKDGEILCPKCANNADWNDAEIIGYDVYEEGPVIQCANCNDDIESAYGDPEQEEN